MLRAILFDMDGLLANSEPLHQKAEKMLFRYLRVDGSELNKKTFGMKAEDALEFLKENLKFKQSVETARKFWFDAIRNLFLSGVAPMPFAGECVDSMKKAGYPLGLCSSSPGEIVDIGLRSLGLKSYFDVILSGDDVSRGKPDPEIYLEASRRLGIQPAYCIVLEDSPAGALAALAGGMNCIVVPNHYTAHLKFPSGAYLVKDLSVVTPDFISRLFPPE
ncbi:MAG: HAD family phosphatase [Candidatus Eremiobacteraeota bacterium]|nr:HAD family phosphatase [Candidatus Eremiobacteraeota bacterium]